MLAGSSHRACSEPFDRRLKVGLIVDSRQQPWNVHALVRWAGLRPDLEISHLLVCRHPRRSHGPSWIPDTFSRGKAPNGLSAALFSVLRRLEALLIGPQVREIIHPGKSDLAEFFHDRVIDLVAAARPSTDTQVAAREGEGDRHAVLDEETLASVARLGLDLLVKIGPGWIPDELVQAVRLGALALEHDGEVAGSSETAGFWDLYFKRDTTGFTIRKQMAATGEAAILTRGHVRNRFSLLWNQTVLHKKSLYYLQKHIVDVAMDRRLPRASPREIRLKRWTQVPKAREQIAYFLGFLSAGAMRLVGERILKREARWSVFYAPCDWKQLDMRQAARIDNPKNTFLADPFLLEENGRTYCFAEEWCFDDRKGCIAVYELSDSVPVRIGEAIREPFHMSFPYLFRHGSSIYMVPETSENRDVRVYECIGLPDKWELRKTLMTDVSTADTMLFEHGGRWWMLTNLDPAETGDYCAELHVFFADDPLSEHWIPHAENPVLIDARNARNAGILFDGRSIYRVSQRQRFDTYGSDFSINRIDVLTPDHYAESEYRPDRLDCLNRPECVHHLHSNGRFSVFDRWKVESVRT